MSYSRVVPFLFSVLIPTFFFSSCKNRVNSELQAQTNLAEPAFALKVNDLGPLLNEIQEFNTAKNSLLNYESGRDGIEDYKNYVATGKRVESAMDQLFNKINEILLSQGIIEKDAASNIDLYTDSANALEFSGGFSQNGKIFELNINRTEAGATFSLTLRLDNLESRNIIAGTSSGKFEAGLHKKNPPGTFPSVTVLMQVKQLAFGIEK